MSDNDEVMNKFKAVNSLNIHIVTLRIFNLPAKAVADKFFKTQEIYNRLTANHQLATTSHLENFS